MAGRPFYGEGGAIPIAKMNMQAATAPGRAYAQMGKDFGEKIGSALKTYGENKKKGEAAEMGIGAILESMSDERKEELASGENPLSKSLQKFMEGELPNSKKEALLGSLVTLDNRDRMDRQEELAKTNAKLRGLQMQQIIQNMADQKDANQLADETRLKKEKQNQIYDKFLIGREMVDMPIGVQDQNPLMRGVEQPTAQVPQGDYMGNRFMQTEQGRSDFTSMVDSGIDPSDALVMASKSEARFLDNQPKAMTKKEELDYIVKLNQELRNQAADKRKTSEFEEENKPLPPEDSKYAEATLTAIDDALGFLTDDTKKFFSTGVIGQALSNIAGTDATSLRAKLDTITSGVGFGRLSDMREASKTGGALGNVSEIELRQLNASMGSLDPNQKPSELKKTLESIKKQYESTVRVLQAEKYAYDNQLTFNTQKEAMDFVNKFHGSSPQQTANTIDPADLQSEIDRKKQMIRDRDLQNKYFDNPTIQNLGNVNQGN